MGVMEQRKISTKVRNDDTGSRPREHSVVNPLFTAWEAQTSRVHGPHPRSYSWLATGSEDGNAGVVSPPFRIPHATFQTLGGRANLSFLGWQTEQHKTKL